MLLVLVADDAYAFMVMWETMALSSFFLVTTNHRIPEIRRAGFLYLLVAHVGAIAILLCFGVLQANTGDYTFASMRAQQLSPFWASLAFLLALFGFGAKAGILPLHVWLPEAHPAAPSPVSALMSGVMLKTAIYGVLRVFFDLVDTPLWWCGLLLLAVGLATVVRDGPAAQGQAARDVRWRHALRHEAKYLELAGRQRRQQVVAGLEPQHRDLLCEVVGEVALSGRHFTHGPQDRVAVALATEAGERALLHQAQRRQSVALHADDGDRDVRLAGEHPPHGLGTAAGR